MTYMTKTLVLCPLSAFSKTPRDLPSWPAEENGDERGGGVIAIDKNNI